MSWNKPLISMLNTSLVDNLGISLVTFMSFKELRTKLDFAFLNTALWFVLWTCWSTAVQYISEIYDNGS